jgi:ABC-2 type transport system permease protein
MFRGTYAIWKREMRKWYRNRTQLVSSLLLPVLFLVIVGNAYSGDFSHVRVAIVNNDSETPGQVFSDRLQNFTVPNSIVLVFDVVGVNTITIDEAQTMIDQGRLDGLIVIPVNFSNGLLGITRNDTQINVTVDNTNLMVKQALEGVVAQVLNETIHDSRVGDWYTSKTGHSFPPSPPAINIVDRYVAADYKFIDFLAPGILAMTVLFTSLFAAGMPVMLDREIGYFDMLLTTPVRRSELVLGFTLAGVTKVVAQATFVLVIAIFLGIHMVLTLLSILYLYILVILLSLGFVGISIALSVKIDITAFQFVNGLINFPVFFLSGAFYPLQSLPDWLRIAVQLNPMSYAVDAMRGVMIKGISLLYVLPDLAVVAVFALLTQLLGNFMLYSVLSGKTRVASKKRKKPHAKPAVEPSAEPSQQHVGSVGSADPPLE